MKASAFSYSLIPGTLFLLLCVCLYFTALGKQFCACVLGKPLCDNYIKPQNINKYNYKELHRSKIPLASVALLLLGQQKASPVYLFLCKLCPVKLSKLCTVKLLQGINIRQFDVKKTILCLNVDFYQSVVSYHHFFTWVKRALS